ncbi:MAG: VOC family protein [Verrucomicrobia bacterium]|nr:VOC family protein [Verrucomicrobiota bacterium]
MPAKPIPDGYHSLTPYLIIRDCAKAIDFYKQVFGATEIARMPGPGGGIMHAELRIGDSVLMVRDENIAWGDFSPQHLNGSAGQVFVYDPAVDAVYARALAAGAKSILEPQDMFWGDRFAKFADPFGHNWAVATHIKDMTMAEIQEASKAFFAQMQQ